MYRKIQGDFKYFEHISISAWPYEVWYAEAYWLQFMMRIYTDKAQILKSLAMSPSDVSPNHKIIFNDAPKGIERKRESKQ